jgi:CMP-N,N'-diacetyllegionaminic acid synthase
MMEFNLHYIAFIPARAGSKSIHRKNMSRLGGRSLISWSIQAAKRANIFEEIVISSDDEEFLEEGRKAGASLLLRRPIEIAGDTTKQIEVLSHASRELRAIGKEFKYIVLLQPTAPFRRPAAIRAAVSLHQQNQKTTLISVCDVSTMHDSTLYQGELENLETKSANETDFKGTLRQSFENRFWRNGSIYILNRDEIDRGNLYTTQVIGFEMSNQESVNIDEPQDMLEAENFLTSETGRRIYSEIWE